MSLAFTFTESTSLFTRDTSPLRQASKSSRKAPPVAQTPSPGLVAPEPGLVLQLLAPPMFVWELLLLQRGLARAAVVVVVSISGEAGVGSILPLNSWLPSVETKLDDPTAVKGESGGVEITAFRGGDCSVVCCCCDDLRDTAILPRKICVSAIRGRIQNRKYVTSYINMKAFGTLLDQLSCAWHEMLKKEII